MKWLTRITGMMEVKRKLEALSPKLQKSITNKAMGKSTKVAVKAIRTELGSGAVFDSLKILSKPNRIARGKAKTEKGQIAAAARMSRTELKRSIGVRKFPRSRMRDKGTIFHAVGPRAGFKITNIRSSKRIPFAATTVSKTLEEGNSMARPTGYTKKAMRACKGPFRDAMIAAAKDLIAKASET